MFGILTIIFLQKNNNNQRAILPIIIPYNKIGIELARSWKSIIGQGQLFGEDSRLITAFCNGKNLGKNLAHSLSAIMYYVKTYSS